VAAIVYLAVFGSVIAFWAYYALIKVMDATTVSLSTLIIPVVGVVSGMLFLGDAEAGALQHPGFVPSGNSAYLRCGPNT